MFFIFLSNYITSKNIIKNECGDLYTQYMKIGRELKELENNYKKNLTYEDYFFNDTNQTIENLRLKRNRKHMYEYLDLSKNDEITNQIPSFILLSKIY